MSAAPDEWAPPPTTSALPPDEVHVWRVGLVADDSAARRLLDRLSAAEIERAGRFRFDADRRRFVAAHAALRSILAGYVGLEPAELTLALAGGGKPFVEIAGTPSPIRFNLSHSQDLALVAVSHQREVGIDLEWLARARDAEGIAARYFSTVERRALDRLTGDDRRRAVLRAWVVKEAYLKACGDGLTRRLEDFDVVIGADEGSRLLEVRDRPGDESRWTLRCLRPHPEFVAALAVEGDGWRLAQWRRPG